MDQKRPSNREPLGCPVSGQRIAYIDWETHKLYLWCKCASCKGWHEYDLAKLEQEYQEKMTHVA